MAETKRIKRLGVWSLAKFQGIIAGALFFALGLFNLLLGTAFFSFLRPLVTMEQFHLGIGALIGVGFGLGLTALLVASVFFGLVGFIFGGLTALVYNFMAARIGGLEIELDEG